MADPYHGYPNESLYHESHTLAGMAEVETNRRERAEMRRRVKFIDASRNNPDHPLWAEDAGIDLNLHDNIGDKIEAAGEHFVAGRMAIAACLLREAADRIDPEHAKATSVEALRDAISFIQGQARLHHNEGTPIARERAEMCWKKAAELYPIYARLSGCEVEA